ncbi:hypothetical protein [Candidatus Nitrosocosmicus sp. R]
MIAAESIIIHTIHLSKYIDKYDLFELESPVGLYQTYSGIYNFETITKIIDGYKPIRILVYCSGMHASTIVKIIVTIQIRKYRLRIHRVVIQDEKSIVRTMILRFWSPWSSNFA